MTTWTEYLYRWHVLAIHFPIALLVTAAIVEAGTMPRRNRRSPQLNFSLALVSFTMTAFGAIGAVLAAWLGWKLAKHTNHPGMEQVLTLHRWSGIAAAGLAIISAGIGMTVIRAPGARKRRLLYSVITIITAIIIAVTSHWGGTLIYGEDYFFPNTTTQDQIEDDL